MCPAGNALVKVMKPMKKVLKVTTLLVLIGWVLFFYPLISVLAISDYENNRIIAVFRQSQAEFFHIEFTHSVNKTPVREYFRLLDCGIMLKRAEYSSLGAGMPILPETDSSEILFAEDTIILDQINLCSEMITYRIGDISRHTLHIKDQAWLVGDFKPDKSAFVFSQQKVSLFMYITKRQ